MKVAFTSKDRHKVWCFLRYALDAEGMRFKLAQNENTYKVTYENYDAQVVRALVRNFNSEWMTL